MVLGSKALIILAAGIVASFGTVRMFGDVAVGTSIHNSMVRASIPITRRADTGAIPRIVPSSSRTRSFPFHADDLRLELV